LWLPKVPAWALRLILGEKADLLLMGQKVSSEKIQKLGYAFQYPNLEEALKESSK
jgi:NAD dependent epimerase/dehydratase family enzyme